MSVRYTDELQQLAATAVTSAAAAAAAAATVPDLDDACRQCYVRPSGRRRAKRRLQRRLFVRRQYG